MMDLSVVYSKTAKGLRARASLIGGLSSQLMKVLTHIDGKSEAETILGKFVQLSEQELASVLTQLENEGYIKPVAVRTADDWAPTTNFTPMIVEEYLDEAEVEARAKEQARLEAERQAREAEEKARIEAEEARARAKEKAEAKVKARLEVERIAREAEEKARAEAEQARAKAEAEEKARLEAERKAKAEEKARLEAERKAREAEEKARAEAEKARAKAEAEAKENARREIERIAREAEEAQKKAEAEQARAKAEAEEKARLEAERKAKAEEKARLEAERQAKEAEEKARAEAEKARVKAEAEAKENARREIERIAREAEEAQKKAEAEKARAKAAEEARLEAERKAKAEEAARLEVERKAKAEEETRLEAERVARQAEEQARVEAEQARAKAEAEEKARIETEENTRREMKRIIREAEEERRKSEAKAKAARLETKRKAKAEEDARLKAERKAQQEAERVRAKAEAEERARAEAKEKTRLEMERIAQEAEKERKKSRTEALAKDADEAQLRVNNETLPEQEAEAEGQAKAEAQEKAKFEAERVTRETEKARNIFFEDDERVLSEEDLRELAEEEAELEAGRAPKIGIEESTQEADEKARQDAEDLAREEVRRIAKEDAKAEARLKAQAKTQAMLRLAAASVKKWSKRGIKATLMGLPLLVLLLIVLLPYINLGMLVEPIEKIASKSTGEPVTVKNVHASLWPEPSLVIGDVAIGVNPGHKIETVHVFPVTSTLLDLVKVVKSLEIDGLEIEQENSGQALQWISNAGRAKHLKIEQINLKNMSLKIRDLELGPFAGKVGINDSHELKNIELSTSDQALSVQILPHGGSYELVLSATHWPLPVNPKIVFDSLNAKGILNQNQINFSQLKGEIYGGSFTANAVVDWGNQWSTSGDFRLSRADMQQVMQAFNSAASIGGKLNLAGKFVCKSATAARLIEASEITGNFDMSHGSFNGVELTRAVLSRESQSLAGDSTHFDTLAGNVQIKNGLYQYRKLILEAPQLRARGQVDVMPNQDISGRISANLAAQSRRLYANFGLTGKVNDVRRQ